MHLKTSEAVQSVSTVKGKGWYLCGQIHAIWDYPAKPFGVL